MAMYVCIINTIRHTHVNLCLVPCTTLLCELYRASSLFVQTAAAAAAHRLLKPFDGRPTRPEPRHVVCYSQVFRSLINILIFAPSFPPLHHRQLYIYIRYMGCTIKSKCKRVFFATQSELLSYTI